MVRFHDAKVASVYRKSTNNSTLLCIDNVKSPSIQRARLGRESVLCDERHRIDFFECAVLLYKDIHVLDVVPALTDEAQRLPLDLGVKLVDFLRRLSEEFRGRHVRLLHVFG